MARVELCNVSVLFPVYNAGRSLKNALFGRSTGGTIMTAARNRHPTLVRALTGINLRLEDGDRLALIGHNGAGKSTLLRVLAGIYLPSEGRVQIRGQAVPMFDISLGMDMDSTGYENIVLRGLYLGLTKAAIDARLEDIADFSELGEFLSLPLRTYSSGMRMRLAFSVCTAISAEILLVDEGLGAGDAAFIEKADERIAHFSNRSSILVLAAHNPPLLKKLCNKAVLMNHGAIIGSGTVDEVLYQYTELLRQQMESS
ncbi:MAG: sugar ABC transporter ATP-binding protein [Halochromatium sp.]|nr:sugar ABC transporter ATP-binding protein [Halochromatium sp.]